ncbi:MAG: 30S ribosomal protein S11 [Patescibacteria group bacterium]
MPEEKKPAKESTEDKTEKQNQEDSKKAAKDEAEKLDNIAGKKTDKEKEGSESEAKKSDQKEVKEELAAKKADAEGSTEDSIQQESSQKEIKIKRKKKRKVRRQIQKGKAFVKSTYNNTVVTLCDLHGNTLAWSSSGLLGFKGAKKATTYAASQVVTDVAEKVQKYGLKDLEVFVKGVGSGRESAVRTLAQKGFNLNVIKDKTPIPHNGCRPPKPRRV